MSKQHNNNIKDELFNYSPEVDNDALWGALEAHVPAPSKKRRFLPIWFWIGGLSLIGAALIVWNNNDKTVIENTTIKEGIVVVESRGLEQVQEEIIADNINDSQNSNSALISDFKVEKVLNNMPLNKAITANNRKSQVNIDRFDTQQAQSKKSNSDSGSNTPIIGSNSNDVEVNKLGFNEAIIIKDTQLETLAVNNNKVSEEATPLINRNDQNLYEFVSIDNIGLQKLNIDKYLIASSIKPIIKANQNRLWIQVGAGIGQSYQDINVSGDSPYVGIGDLYKMMPSLSFSGLLGYDLSPRLSVYTGVNYNRVTSRLSIENNDVTTSYENGVTSTSIDENGLISDNFGQIETTIDRTNISTWHTYHQYLSIPLGLQFDIIKTRKFDIILNGGLNFNLMDLKYGAVLNEQGALNKFDQSSSPYTSALISPFGGLGVQYKLTNSAIGIQSELIYHNNKYSIIGESISENFLTNNFRITYTHYIK